MKELYKKYELLLGHTTTENILILYRGKLKEKLL